MISIPIPDNFSFAECLWFLDRNYDDCMHAVECEVVRKAVIIKGEIGLLEIRQAGNSLEIRLLSGNVDSDEIIQFVTEWFDIERDINPFYQLLEADSDFLFMTSDFKGLRLLGIVDAFEALCWCIIGQQINLTFAYALKRRLTEAYGTKMEYEGNTYWIFPEPEFLAKLSPPDLRVFQFSEKKAEYIIEAAAQFATGNISKAILDKLPTAEAIKKLTAIRGIGEWTANYLLMKSLRRQECITHGDVGMFNALVKLKNYPKKPEKELILSLFDNYAGWEAYLVFYLWRSLAAKLVK
jgi:DNA-3-methyladenine glycosylase II